MGGDANEWLLFAAAVVLSKLVRVLVDRAGEDDGTKAVAATKNGSKILIVMRFMAVL